MKKGKFILLFVLSFFSFNMIVNAEYCCVYSPEYARSNFGGNLYQTRDSEDSNAVECTQMPQYGICSASNYRTLGSETSTTTKKEDYHIDDVEGCPLGPLVTKDILQILDLFRIIAPLLVVVLTVFETIKALVDKDPDKQITAYFTKIGKRVAAAVALFLVPLVVKWIFDIFDISSGCDLDKAERSGSGNLDSSVQVETTKLEDRSVSADVTEISNQTVTADVINIGTDMHVETNDIGQTIYVVTDNIGQTYQVSVTEIGGSVVAETNKIGQTIYVKTDEIGTTMHVVVDKMGTTYQVKINDIGQTQYVKIK